MRSSRPSMFCGPCVAHVVSNVVVYACLVFLAALRQSAIASTPSIPSLEERLEHYGYPTETEQHMRAVLSADRYHIRKLGLRLLVERNGKQAIRTLKTFLNDEKLTVRVTAAGLLGQLGDHSGLPVMQQEYTSLIGPEEEQRDPAVLKKLSPYAINPGLEVAKALAKLGDYRGYHLALYVFDHQDSKVKALRGRAVEVLGEVARAEPRRLTAEGIDLWSAYDKAVDTVESSFRLMGVLRTVRQEGVDPALAAHVADRVLATRRLKHWAQEYVRDTVKPRLDERLQEKPDQVLLVGRGRRGPRQLYRADRAVRPARPPARTVPTRRRRT